MQLATLPKKLLPTAKPLRHPPIYKCCHIQNPTFLKTCANPTNPNRNSEGFCNLVADIGMLCVMLGRPANFELSESYLALLRFKFFWTNDYLLYKY
jgi:hypothetical protein